MSMLEEAIRPLFAALNPDGSISVELMIPGNDKPTLTMIPPMEATKHLVVPNTRRIADLDDEHGDEANTCIRQIVAEFVEMAQQRWQEAAAEA